MVAGVRMQGWGKVTSPLCKTKPNQTEPNQTKPNQTKHKHSLLINFQFHPARAAKSLELTSRMSPGNAVCRIREAPPSSSKNHSECLSH